MEVREPVTSPAEAATVPAVREVRIEDVPDWDARAVAPPGGNVYQGREWSEYRSRWGWASRYLLFDDGFPVLSLERRWPLVPGAGAYVSKGPIPSDAASTTARRLIAVARCLAERGVDVVSADPEVPAGQGYERVLAAAGFRQIEEIQPSRHRMALPLPAGIDDEAVFRSFAKTTQQLIRGAEKAGLRVVRYEGAAVSRAPVEGLEDAPPDNARLPEAYARLYALIEKAAERRHFGITSRPQFVDWGCHGAAAGLIVQLQVRSPDDELLGAAMFYRHGGRLTYSHSADRADLRRQYPGVGRLLLWRAIQLAMREGMAEVDFAGVDVPGARRMPQPGDEMYGLYQYKRTFGAEWVELAGNHEWVARPRRYALGRATGKVVRTITRSR